MSAAWLRDASIENVARATYGLKKFHCDYIKVKKPLEHTRSLTEGSKNGIVHSTQVVPTAFRKPIEVHRRVNVMGQRIGCLSPKGCHPVRHSSKPKIAHVRQTKE